MANNLDDGLPGLETDPDTDDEWEADESMHVFDSSENKEDLQSSQVVTEVSSTQETFISNGAMTTQSNNYNEPILNDVSLPALISETDSDGSWSTIDDFSSSSDSSSDDGYWLDENLSEPSDEDSSLEDDEEFGVFEMLSHHLETFGNAAPTFFGLSLQMFYERLMESLEIGEEKDTPTPEHVLNSLPKVKATIAQVALNSSCCICFGEYVLNDEMLRLPCSHEYHSKCILNWLKIKCTCPTCRFDLNTQPVLSTNSSHNNTQPVVSTNSSHNNTSGYNTTHNNTLGNNSSHNNIELRDNTASNSSSLNEDISNHYVELANVNGDNEIVYSIQHPVCDLTSSNRRSETRHPVINNSLQSTTNRSPPSLSRNSTLGTNESNRIRPVLHENNIENSTDLKSEVTDLREQKNNSMSLCDIKNVSKETEIW